MPILLTVTDPADPNVEAYRDIRERDLVGRQRLFVAEGRVVLEKLIGADACLPLSVLVADRLVSSLEPLLAGLPEGVPVFVAKPAVIDALAGFHLHRGVLAIGRRPEDPGADLLLERAADLAPRGTVLLLHGIANHDNMGGIFRNAAAFGVGGVLLDSSCCDPLYRKAIRVSVGGVFTVPFARLERGVDALPLLERHGFAPLALSPSGVEALGEVCFNGCTAVLLGAEGPGLDPMLLARVRTVRIPMAGDFDSLNVATTSGIVLHHLASGC